MAKSYNNTSNTFQHVSVPFNYVRGNPQPLDNDEIWNSFDAAQEYARTGSTSYVGQQLNVVENGDVKCYVIKNEAGDLQEVGGDGKAIMYDMEIEHSTLFPLRINNNQNNAYVIVYDEEQQAGTQSYNYIVGLGSSVSRGTLPLNEILSFNVEDSEISRGTMSVGKSLKAANGNSKLVLNVDLTGSYDLPWKDVAEFSIATGNSISLSADTYSVIGKYTNAFAAPKLLKAAPLQDNEEITQINAQAALDNDIENAFTEDVDVKYLERTICNPLSIAFADANTYMVAVEHDKIKSDILYDIQSDQLNAYNKTVINVADPELPTDAVNKQWIIDILRDYALTSDIPSEGKPLLVSVTYSEIMNMIDNRQLVPGQQYKITDYEATINGNYIGKFTLADNVWFDIIVTADSEDGLNENARAELHNEYAGFGPGMQRNDKPWKWQLKYTVYNDQSEYAWADPDNGKGVVYWLKDEFNNEAFFDFKNIEVVIDDNTMLAIGNQCRNCIIKDCADDFATYDIKQNVICDNCINVQIGEDSDNVRIGYSCKNVIIGYQATNIRVDDSCESIRIGDNISDVDVESGSCKKYIDEA